MSMSIATKALIAGGTLGVVGGGGYAATYLLSDNSPKSINQEETKPKNISDQLVVDGYTVLADGNDNWTSIFAQYQLVAGGNSDLKFTDATINSKENLQSQCKKVFVLASSDITNYKRGAKWCTAPRTLKDILNSGKRRTLSTDNSNDATDQSEWNTKINEHNDSSKNQGKKLTISGATSGQLTHSPNDRNKIRDACRALEVKKHYEQSFESDLEKSTLWCSVVKNT